MNNSSSVNVWKPKQALSPTAAVLDELIGDAFEGLARESITVFPPSTDSSPSTPFLIHDNACGTGAATSALINLLPTSNLTIHATDINPEALERYTTSSNKHGWKSSIAVMDSQKLSFEDNTFDYVIGNGILFVLPNDGIGALKETYRTLKPGGSVVVNLWSYIPNMAPLRTASAATRGPSFPVLRPEHDRYTDPKFLETLLGKAGFEAENIEVVQREVVSETTELKRFANLLWSFTAGTTEKGWVDGDEKRWDEAVEKVVEELRKERGFGEVEGGKARLTLVANIARARK